MMTSEQEYDSLWSDLGAEFESQEETPLKIETGPPPTKQRTFMVAFRESIFAGFYPMLAICLLAAVASMPSWETGVLPGLSALLAFPLAALLAPLMRDPKRGFGLCALLAIIAGGVTELTTSVAEMTHRHLQQASLDNYEVVSIVQSHLESFLSFRHWLGYALLGVVVAGLTYRYRKSVPWLDSPPTGRVRWLVVGCLAFAPFLLTGGTLVVGQLQSGQPSQWLAALRVEYPTAGQLRGDAALEAEWNSLVEPVRLVSDPDQRMGIRNLDLRGFQGVEAQYLKLVERQLAAPGYPPYAGVQAAEALLSRPHDLKDRYAVAEAHLRYSYRQRQYGIPVGEEIPHLRYLEALASAPRAELSTQVVQAQKLQDQLLSPFVEMELIVARQVSWYIDPRKDWRQVRSFELFGQTLRHSPTVVWQRHQMEPIIEPWLEIRSQLEAMSPAQQRELLTQRAAQLPEESSQHIFHTLTRAVYSDQLTPYYEAARLLLECKQFRNERGYWPAAPEALDGRSPSTRWSFKVSGDTLTITDTLFLDQARGTEPTAPIREDHPPEKYQRLLNSYNGQLARYKTQRDACQWVLK